MSRFLRLVGDPSTTWLSTRSNMYRVSPHKQRWKGFIPGLGETQPCQHQRSANAGKCLLDLVKPKSYDYLPAFSEALGNTLVAKDMDQANRIAFGGTRVVTLDGGLIETSAMSGAGSQPSRGAMNSVRVCNLKCCSRMRGTTSRQQSNCRWQLRNCGKPRRRRSDCRQGTPISTLHFRRSVWILK